MEYFIQDQIGPKRALTPEGYLLCRDVPIARTGPLVYMPRELPMLTPGSSGVIVVHRSEEEVFSPQTIASFNGKPVVDDHPPGQLLTADTWKQYSVGTVQSVRRGEGPDEQLLLADLLVTDAAAISEVMSGKRQISCGYNADYEEIEPGQARQLNIVGNHVALVRQGRCGAICAIGDQMPAPLTMAERLASMRATRDAAILAANKTFDEAIAAGDNIGNPGMGAMPDPSGRIIVNVHGAAKAGGTDAPPMPGAAPAAPAPAAPAAPAAPGGDMGAVLQQILMELKNLTALLTEGEGEEGADPDEFQTASQNGPDPDIGEEGEQKTQKKMEAGDEGDLTKPVVTKKVGEPMGKTGTGSSLPGSATGDKKPAKKAATKDSASLETHYRDIVSRAEILVPGKEAPTFDAQAPEADTAEALAGFQRAVLSEALGNAAIKPAVMAMVGTADIASIEPDRLGLIFVSASEVVKAARSATAHVMPSAAIKFNDNSGKGGGQVTPKDINEKAAKLWQRPAA